MILPGRQLQVAARPDLAEADLLIRNLESQLRRQRDGALAGPEFSAGLQRWAERFRLAMPEFAAEADAIAATFPDDSDLVLIGVRLERIGSAMRLLARLRSHMAGETPRQVKLPGAAGPPPAVAPPAVAGPRLRGTQDAAVPSSQFPGLRPMPGGRTPGAAAQPLPPRPHASVPLTAAPRALDPMQPKASGRGEVTANRAGNVKPSSARS
ncbi:MAG TPA: hypothetical protein VIU62_02560, partial [Chloroflexota bacterium]